MAEGGLEDVDPLFTMDVVREFMVANDCKVTNHTLVTHFKSFLNDSRRKNANRLKFKQYVNTLATVKLDASGEKLLVLKKKYRDSGSFRGVVLPAASKLPSSGQGRDNDAKKPKKDDELAQLSFTADATDQKSEYDSENQSNLKASLENIADDVASDTAVTDDKGDEEMSIEEPTKASDVEDMQPQVPDTTVEFASSDNIDQIDISPDNTDMSMDAHDMEKENLDPGKLESLGEQHGTDVMDSSTSHAVYTPKVDHQPVSEGVVSVREMAKQLNKVDSPSSLTPRAQLTPQMSGRVKRDRESRRADDGVYEFSLNETEREWTIKSAYSDYQALAKLLQTNPSLAGRRDFLSGYTALHWAAKNGKADVVKLLFGSKEPPNVDARSHGGYTALHVATMHGQDEVIQLLVDVYLASPNIRDYSGRKPKHYSAHSALSTRVQQMLQPGSAHRLGSSRTARASHHEVNSYAAEQYEAIPFPSPGSSPGPSSRKGSVHSDSGLMPPPRELPAVIRKRPVISSSADQLQKECHSDSEMQRAGSDPELRGCGSTPNFSSSAFV